MLRAGVRSRTERNIMVGAGEYQAIFIDKTGVLWGAGNTQTRGGNGAGTVGIPIKCAVPAGTRFKFAAGALHGAAAIDISGNVWTVCGDNNQGQAGTGDTVSSLLPVKILTDINNAAFTNVKWIQAFFPTPTGNNGYLAIKEDGTLWVWGQPMGLLGNGTDTSSLVLRPTQITIPGGRIAKKVVCGYIAILLCTDGTVWTWGSNTAANLGRTVTGSDYASLVQISSLSGITDIAGGYLTHYAYKGSTDTLYGWGTNTGGGGFNPNTTPIALTTIKNAMGAPISKLMANSVTSYAITTDGKLWAWGGNECGSVGNGEELDYDPSSPTYSGFNYGWDFGYGEKHVDIPYNVAPTRKFIDVFGSCTWNFYVYALDTTGQLYCWGRNKGSVLTNAIENAGININGTYANAWDLTWPTPVNPFNITNSYKVTCPYCISNPSGSPCNEYVIPANTAPVANAGTNQTISVSSVKLNGTGSTDNVFIMKYEWSQVSGPNTAIIDLPASPTPIVSGLIDGTYVFRLKVTDTGWMTSTATVSITKSSVALDSSITVPTNSGGSTTQQALLHLPNDYNSTSTSYPLLIFCHGAGEAGSNLSLISNSSTAGGPAYFIAQNSWPTSFTNPTDNQQYKFIVVSPQASNWSTMPPALDYIIQYLVNTYRVDATRIYLTGLSAGGAETCFYTSHISNNITTGARDPYTPVYKPAAFVPMSMATNTPNQAMQDATIADNVHVWGFGDPINDSHGQNTQLYIQGGNVFTGCNCTGLGALGKFTSYSGGHCCWNTYYNPTYRETFAKADNSGNASMNIYEWMLQYHR